MNSTVECDASPYRTSDLPMLWVDPLSGMSNHDAIFGRISSFENMYILFDERPISLNMWPSRSVYKQLPSSSRTCHAINESINLAVRSILRLPRKFPGF